MLRLLVNQIAQEVCKFNFSIETEELFKVTGSHVHCRSGSMW